MCDLGPGPAPPAKPGSFEEFRELYAGDVLALWLDFDAARHADGCPRHLFQFMSSDAFLRLAYEFS